MNIYIKVWKERINHFAPTIFFLLEAHIDFDFYRNEGNTLKKLYLMHSFPEDAQWEKSNKLIEFMDTY